MPYKDFFKTRMPNFFLRFLHRAGLYQNYIPKYRKISFGDFNRTTPFSRKFGYDRGGPVDRYYIENFLEKNSEVIRGRVLEIGDNEYTIRFGAQNVLQSDILHIDTSNTKATIIGDLSDAPQIQDKTFDCIILTQTLHLIYDYKKALETCYRILKPGGTLLITVPGIGHIDQGTWYKYWLWAFTDTSIKRLLGEIFPVDGIVVQPFGNVLVATAFLYGIGLPEMKSKQMDYQDPHYQVIIAGLATKPSVNPA
jgi:SAM-dependent methyltransferase